MAFSRKSLVGLIKSFLPDIGAAVRRFPLAALIAVVFTALNLFDAKQALGLDGDAWMRVSFGLGAGFLWSVSVSLYAERKSWGYGRRFIAELSGFGVIAALYTLQIVFSLQPQLFFIGLAILVGLAPYINLLPAPNASFWHFNHHLWLGAAIALLGAVLFSGGLSVIVETLELLFDVKFPKDSHENIWITGLGLIAPLNWLSLISEDFSVQVPEGDQEEFTSRAVAIIVKYVLVPLLLVYTAILYAYAAKIGIDGVFPKGRVGPMVLGYGLLGTLTVLFAWPSRKAGGPLVSLFWRHWFWLTLGPVALLFLAASKRISQYGVTEQRYLVVLAGIWLCAMALWFLVRRSARDIRIIPLSLCVLLLLASFGPWGAVGWSVRNQKSELVNLLEASGRMKDGQIVVAGKNNPLPDDKARRANSILTYLQRHDRLDELDGWFGNLQEHPFAKGDNQEQMACKVARLIGVPANLSPLRKPENFYFSVDHPTLMQLSGFDEVIGPITILGSKPNPTLTVAGGTSLDIGLEKNIVTFRLSSGPELKFDVEDAARRATELRWGGRSPDRSDDPRVPLKVMAQNDGGSIMLIVKMRGKVSEDEADLQSLKVWLLLKRQ
jgi:hypothetical protein